MDHHRKSSIKNFFNFPKCDFFDIPTGTNLPFESAPALNKLPLCPLNCWAKCYHIIRLNDTQPQRSGGSIKTNFGRSHPSQPNFLHFSAVSGKFSRIIGCIPASSPRCLPSGISWIPHYTITLTRFHDFSMGWYKSQVF